MGINGGTGIVGSGAALGGSGIHISRGGVAPLFSFGNALEFDGVNDVVDLTTPITTGTDFAIFIMYKQENNTDRNELEIHVVGTSASGKSTIQLIIAEALKDKGFNVKINSSDHESEDDFFDTYKNNQELRESSVLKLNDLITINEVQALKTFKTKTKMSKDLDFEY